VVMVMVLEGVSPPGIFTHIRHLRIQAIKPCVLWWNLAMVFLGDTRKGHASGESRPLGAY
jgi:hypothetical protein